MKRLFAFGCSIMLLMVFADSSIGAAIKTTEVMIGDSLVPVMVMLDDDADVVDTVEVDTVIEDTTVCYLDHALRVNNMSSCVGDDVTLTFDLLPGVPIDMFDVVLELPEGISVAMNEMGLGIVELEGAVNTLTQLICLPDSNYVVIAYITSFGEKPLSDEGCRVNVKLRIDENVQEGLYQIIASVVELYDDKGNSYHTDDVVGMLAVKPHKKNNNERVDESSGTYTTDGVMVKTNHIRNGLHITNGKKVMVK